jgi:hypothetical protein
MGGALRYGKLWSRARPRPSLDGPWTCLRISGFAPLVLAQSSTGRRLDDLGPRPAVFDPLITGNNRAKPGGKLEKTHRHGPLSTV